MQSVGLLVFNSTLSLNCSEEIHVILCKKKPAIIVVTRPSEILRQPLPNSYVFPNCSALFLQ